MTQEDISVAVGRSRPAIANSVRLLTLQDKLKGLVISGDLSSGHARALLSIEDNALQIKASEEIISKGLTVRETEKLVKRVLNKKEKKAPKKLDEEYLAIEDRFREILGTKVKIVRGNKNGKIMIEYYSLDELERIVELIESLSKTSEAL